MSHIKENFKPNNILTTARLFVIILVVGVIVGIAASVFRWLLPQANHLFFGLFNTSADDALNPMYVLHRPYIIILPAIGGLLVGLFLHYFAKEAQGHGVAEVMARMETQGSRIPAHVSAYTAVASSLTIGSGGSAGPEGPAIQIGAALGSGIGQFFKLSRDNMKTVLACGAATGLAVLYNAPLAGTFFAIEVLLLEIKPQRFALIAISAITGHLVATHLFPNAESLISATYQQNSWESLPLDFVLGLAAAPIGVGFILAVHKVSDYAEGVKTWPWLKPAIGGLIVGLIGILFPRIYGVGEITIQQAIYGFLPLALLLTLPFLKVLATGITLGSGGSGGVFTPAIFMGATLGSAYGLIIKHFLPGVPVNPAAFALIGTGTIIASAVNAPLTAIMIVVELTGDFYVLPGVIAAVAGSILLSRYMYPESMYTLPLVLRGIKRGHGAPNPLAHIFARDFVSTDWPTLTPNTTLQQVIDSRIAKRRTLIPLVDRKGKYSGLVDMIAVVDKLGASKEQNLGSRKISSFKIKSASTAEPDETLHEVLKKPGVSKMIIVPVVDNHNNYLGAIPQSSILDAYSQ